MVDIRKIIRECLFQEYMIPPPPPAGTMTTQKYSDMSLEALENALEEAGEQLVKASPQMHLDPQWSKWIRERIQSIDKAIKDKKNQQNISENKYRPRERMSYDDIEGWFAIPTAIGHFLIYSPIKMAINKEFGPSGHPNDGKYRGSLNRGARGKMTLSFLDNKDEAHKITWPGFDNENVKKAVRYVYIQNLKSNNEEDPLTEDSIDSVETSWGRQGEPEFPNPRSPVMYSQPHMQMVGAPNGSSPNTITEATVDRTIVFTKEFNPSMTITIVVSRDGRITEVTNERGLRFPYAVGQPYNRGLETWSCNNGFLMDGKNMCPEKKIFGVKVSDVPQGHEWRLLYPGKFR